MIRTTHALTALLIALLLGLGAVTGGVATAQSDDPSDDSSEPDDDPTDDASEPDDGPSEGPSDGPTDPDDSPTDGPTATPGDGSFAAGARVFGPDRIATSVAISQYEFPSGSEEAYLARSDAFADAVAAGPLSRGPVLLVPQCGELPAVVTAELRRLDPDRVVALGGPSAICDDILQQAVEATGGSGSDDGSADDDGIDDDDPRTESTALLDLAVGESATVDALQAGTATIRRTEGGVELVSAEPATGWAIRPGEEDEPGQAEVSFTDGSTRVDLDAEVEGSLVRVRVRSRAE
jgi:hypothetical protein